MTRRNETGNLIFEEGYFMRVPAILGIIFLAVFTVEAAGLLRNPQFNKWSASGVPSGWTLRDTGLRPESPPRPVGRPALSVADGVLCLDTADGRYEVMLIQYRLPLKKGNNYVLAFEVKGEGAVSWRSPVFRQTAVPGGKTVWKNTPAAWKAAPREWESRQIIFDFPPEAKDAYLYFAATGPGKLLLRNIRLRENGIDLESSAELPVFRPAEMVSYRIGFKSAPENMVRYTLRDFLGTTVASGTATDRIHFSTLANGWYKLTATEINSAGKTVSTARRTFAVIPEFPAELRDAPGNQFGVMVNPHTAYPLDRKELDMKYAARIGVRYLRTHRLNWGRIQSAPGVPYNWDEADAEMALYEKYGIHPVATIGWPVPGWASSAAGTGEPNIGNYFPQEKYLPELKRFHRELAARYGNRIAYYEVGNEVDASNFWMGRYENSKRGDEDAVFRDYVDFYIAVASGLLEGNPKAQVGPGTTGSMPSGHTYRPWLERFWTVPEALQVTTIFCPHYQTDIPEIRKVMRRHGKEVPIVLTEIGGLIKTQNYQTSLEELRQIIKRTYVQYATQLNQGGLALCKFLLRQIPGVREGWVSEMLAADFELRPEYVAYATLIRIVSGGRFERELNVTANASHGWVQAFRIIRPDGVMNLVMLNDAPEAEVVLETPEQELTVTDVMGSSRTFRTQNGRLALAMKEDQPLFISGEIRENPGPVRHPEPVLVLKRRLMLGNNGFELGKGSSIPGWRMIVDETGGTGGKAPFTVESDSKDRSEGLCSLRMSAKVRTRWYGVLCKLPKQEIPVPKTGEFLVFKIAYDQKLDGVTGTGAGVTLAFRDGKMRRVGFNDGNWSRGTSGWIRKTWQSRKFEEFPRGTEQITLEFYLGLATGTVRIDRVSVEVELYRKSNASSAYIN